MCVCSKNLKYFVHIIHITHAFIVCYWFTESRRRSVAIESERFCNSYHIQIYVHINIQFICTVRTQFPINCIRTLLSILCKIIISLLQLNWRMSNINFTFRNFTFRMLLQLSQMSHSFMRAITKFHYQSCGKKGQP